MRVLILSHDKTLFEAGSVSQRRMAERGKICETLNIIVPSERGHNEVRPAGNVRVVPTNSGGAVGKFFNTKKLAKRIVRDERIDLVIAQDPFEFGWIARNIAERYGISWIVELHGDFYSNNWWKSHSGLLNRLRWHVGKRVLRSAANIRAVSERIRMSLVFKLGIPDGRVIVLPVETPVAEYLKAPPSPYLRQRFANFNFFILTVGTLAAVKNIALQIRAFAEIVREFPKTGLVIVGGGQEQAGLEALALRLHIPQNVVFAGQQKDIMPYYLGADAFVLTSYAEGWGRAAVEAMAAGLPVVMTDVGLAGELVLDGKNGLVVPVNDKKALIAALKKLINDEGLRRRLGEEARASVAALPDHEEMLQRYSESWRKCI